MPNISVERTIGQAKKAVLGGLIAMLFVLGRSFAAKKFGTHEATTTIVVSYYWHFVDVVWIALFAVIYLIK